MSISIHELLAVARESEGVKAVQGDDMLCEKRFAPDTRYMVEFLLLEQKEQFGEKGELLWSSIFVTLMANKIGGLQFGIYRNCQISSRVFHTAVAALPLTKANRSDFE